LLWLGTDNLKSNNKYSKKFFDRNEKYLIFVQNTNDMSKTIYLIGVILLMYSCSTTKEFQVPMTEKMYQENKLKEKQRKLVNDKDYLKNYTKKFVKSIPNEDIKLITKDTIIVVCDTTTVR
jgi:ketol-acid reductoisomerase